MFRDGSLFYFTPQKDMRVGWLIWRSLCTTQPEEYLFKTGGGVLAYEKASLNLPKATVPSSGNE